MCLRVGGEQRSPGEESENLSPVNDMEENNAAAELLLVEDGPEFWQCISQNAPGPSGTRPDHHLGNWMKMFFKSGGTTWRGDLKCRKVRTWFRRKRSMQTGSSETLIGWKSRKITYVPLWDRMDWAWLWALGDFFGFYKLIQHWFTAASQIPLCGSTGRMLGYNPGLLRLWHWQSDALSTPLSYISFTRKWKCPFIVHKMFISRKKFPAAM